MPINLLLKCHNMECTKSFYEEILSFEVLESDQGTCTVRKEDCTIIFPSENLWAGHPKFTGSVYMFINDVDA